MVRAWWLRCSISEFNRGDPLMAVATRSANQNLSRVLYPDDSTWNGRELRLRQVSTS